MNDEYAHAAIWLAVAGNYPVWAAALSVGVYLAYQLGRRRHAALSSLLWLATVAGFLYMVLPLPLRGRDDAPQQDTPAAKTVTTWDSKRPPVSIRMLPSPGLPQNSPAPRGGSVPNIYTGKPLTPAEYYARRGRINVAYYNCLEESRDKYGQGFSTSEESGATQCEQNRDRALKGLGPAPAP